MQKSDKQRMPLAHSLLMEQQPFQKERLWRENEWINYLGKCEENKHDVGMNGVIT